MTDGGETDSRTPEEQAETPPAGEQQERQAATSHAAGPEGAGAAAATEPGPGTHEVQDPYVARRLAQEAAARLEAERRYAEEMGDLAGDAVEDSALGFYLLLGLIVAALLLAVIWLSGSRAELPATAIRRLGAPAAAPSPGRSFRPPVPAHPRPEPAYQRPPGRPAPAQPIPTGRAAPPQPMPPGRAAPVPPGPGSRGAGSLRGYPPAAPSPSGPTPALPSGSPGAAPPSTGALPSPTAPPAPGTPGAAPGAGGAAPPGVVSPSRATGGPPGFPVRSPAGVGAPRR